MAKKKKEELELKEEEVIKEDEIVKDEETEIVDDKDKEIKEEEEIVEEVIEDDVEALKQENQDLKDKIAEFENANVVEEKSEKEIALEEREQRIWDKEVSIALKENGLEDFKDFIIVEVGDEKQLDVVVSKLKEIISKIEMENSYVPTETPSVDEYSIARKNKDVKSMIGSKLK